MRKIKDETFGRQMEKVQWREGKRSKMLKSEEGSFRRQRDEMERKRTCKMRKNDEERFSRQKE